MDRFDLRRCGESSVREDLSELCVKVFEGGAGAKDGLESLCSGFGPMVGPVITDFVIA